MQLKTGELKVVENGLIYRNGNEYTVITDKGDGFIATINREYIDVRPFLSASRPQGTVVGLLGSNDGNTQNDLAFKNRTAISRPATAAVLYGEFAEDWQVTKESSLFTYRKGENTTSFNELAFKKQYMTADDFDKEAVAAARTAALKSGYNETSRLFQNMMLELLAKGTNITDGITAPRESDYSDVHKLVVSNNVPMPIALSTTSLIPNASVSSTSTMPRTSLPPHNTTPQTSPTTFLFPTESVSFTPTMPRLTYTTSLPSTFAAPSGRNTNTAAIAGGLAGGSVLLLAVAGIWAYRQYPGMRRNVGAILQGASKRFRFWQENTQASAPAASVAVADPQIGRLPTDGTIVSMPAGERPVPVLLGSAQYEPASSSNATQMENGSSGLWRQQIQTGSSRIAL